VAVWGDELQRKIHSIKGGLFKGKFYEETHDLSGNKGIGAISASQEQPICLNSRFGRLAIAANGWIDNADELAKEMLEKGHSFSEVRRGRINQTELVAKLLNEGRTILEGIENIFNRIEGSCSMLILTGEGIYAARDRIGHFPLILGCGRNGYAVTSETAAFTNLGYKVEKYLGAGEVLLINEGGVEIKRAANKACKTCAFLWIYTGFPTSSYEGINAECVRERCGRCLARRDDIKPDVVAGVPESGVAHAIGYAMESGISYRRPIVKYTPGYGRSYTPPSQDIRDLVATMKLIAVKDVIKGSRMIVCDDSIVRGTQIKNYTIRKLRDNGASEIHLRVACPPLMFPCRYGASTRSKSELASRRAIRALEGKDIDNIEPYLDVRTEKYKRMVEWIRTDLNITSLKYLAIEDLIQAIGLPEEDLCLYCWRGR